MLSPAVGWKGALFPRVCDLHRFCRSGESGDGGGRGRDKAAVSLFAIDVPAELRSVSGFLRPSFAAWAPPVRSVLRFVAGLLLDRAEISIKLAKIALDSDLPEHSRNPAGRKRLRPSSISRIRE